MHLSVDLQIRITQKKNKSNKLAVILLINFIISFEVTI